MEIKKAIFTENGLSIETTCKDKDCNIKIADFLELKHEDKYYHFRISELSSIEDSYIKVKANEVGCYEHKIKNTDPRLYIGREVYKVVNKETIESIRKEMSWQ